MRSAFACPGCSGELSLPPRVRGSRVYCPKCGAGFASDAVVEINFEEDAKEGDGTWFVVALLLGGFGSLAAFITCVVLLWTTAQPAVVQNPVQEPAAVAPARLRDRQTVGADQGASAIPGKPLPPKIGPDGKVPPAAVDQRPRRFPEAIPVPLVTAPLKQDSTVIEVGEKVADTAIGGGGRYWCLLLPETRRVAVFDVNQAAIMRYIPIESSQSLIAAGMNKLLIADPEAGNIVRYDIESSEKEATVVLPFRGILRQMCLGSASAGPMLTCYSEGTDALSRVRMAFLDITSFREIDLGTVNGVLPHISYRDAIHVRSSPDGRLYGSWVSSQTPTGLDAIVLSESEISSRHLHESVGAVVPANGTLLTAGGIFAADLKANARSSTGVRIPSARSPFYLDVAPMKSLGNHGDPPVPARLTVCNQSDSRPILVAQKIQLTVGSDAWSSSDFTQDKRFLFCPEASLLAWIGSTNDKLHLYRLDLRSKQSTSSLFVTSRPPAVSPGQPFRYQITTNAGAAELEYKLESAPPGMTVSEVGVVVWDVPADWKGTGLATVTISGSGGRQIAQKILIAAPLKISPRTTPPIPLPNPSPVPRPTKQPRLSNGNVNLPLCKVTFAEPNPVLISSAAIEGKSQRVSLPAEVTDAVIGGRGRYWCFLQAKLRQVTVLDLNTAKTRRLALDRTDEYRLAAGMNKLLVFEPMRSSVERFDLATMNKDGVAGHPSLKSVTGVSLGSASAGPVLVWCRPDAALNSSASVSLMDLDSFRLFNAAFQEGKNEFSGEVLHARSSPDGRHHGSSATGALATEATSVVISEAGFQAYRVSESIANVLPTSTGNLLTGSGIYSREFARVSPPTSAGAPTLLVPAQQGDTYLKITRTTNAPIQESDKYVPTDVVVCDNAGNPLADLGDIGLPLWNDMGLISDFTCDKRVLYSPAGKVIAWITGTNDAIELYRFDLDVVPKTPTSR